LTNENCELAKKANQFELMMSQTSEKCFSLEDSCTRLETQLADSIKIQDKYMRELHVEKRNLLKKSQEFEELKQSLKYYEQKCDSYEVKLDERESAVTLLKSKLVQTEADLNRLDFEYQRLKNSVKQNR
jgi:chromosome segregation ATPase